MNTADLATAAAGRDPMIALRALTALRQELGALEAGQVRDAREEGWSWQQIAEALGVSKQAVHKKHAAKKPVRRRAQPKATTTRSTGRQVAKAAPKPMTTSKATKTTSRSTGRRTSATKASPGNRSARSSV